MSISVISILCYFVCKVAVIRGTELGEQSELKSGIQFDFRSCARELNGKKWSDEMIVCSVRQLQQAQSK